MPVQKFHNEVFNDGFLTYGYMETLRNERETIIGEHFVEKGSLAFRQMSARESDYQLTDTMGSRLDMKVKTRFPPSFQKVNKNKLSVMIDGDEYDVTYIDQDNVNRFLYFYLERVGNHNGEED